MAAPATTPTEEVTMSHERKLAIVRSRLVAEVEAGGIRPLVRFAERTVARRAGGFVTVLPVEVASATFLRHVADGTVGTADGEAVRAELAATFVGALS